ncbi:MAG: hypothetical protein AAFX76_07365 [Planctomycetota bacterium]
MKNLILILLSSAVTAVAVVGVMRWTPTGDPSDANRSAENIAEPSAAEPAPSRATPDVAPADDPVAVIAAALDPEPNGVEVTPVAVPASPPAPASPTTASPEVETEAADTPAQGNEPSRGIDYKQLNADVATLSDRLERFNRKLIETIAPPPAAAEADTVDPLTEDTEPKS